MEKLIEKQVFMQSDAFLLCITNDKIIVNDSYDGLLLYDEELNLIRRIDVPSMNNLFSLHEMYPLGDEVLIDSGDGMLVLVNLETGAEKALPMSEVLDNEYIDGCARISENTILLRCYQNHDFYLNTDTVTFTQCANMQSDIVIKCGINSHGTKIPEYLHSHDFLRSASLNGIDFYLYDRKLLIMTPDHEMEQHPKEGYYYFRMGAMHGNHPQIIVLGGTFSGENAFLASYRFESSVNQSEPEAIAACVQQPKTIATRTGEFILDRKYGWYERKTSDLNITLSLDKDDKNRKEDCSIARKVFEGYELELPELDSRLKKYATEKLLEVGNEWREDDELPPITATEFAEMISLTGLNFNNDGTVDAFYNDGEIFAGHCIVISIDSDGTMKDADIAG